MRRAGTLIPALLIVFSWSLASRAETLSAESGHTVAATVGYQNGLTVGLAYARETEGVEVATTVEVPVILLPDGAIRISVRSGGFVPLAGSGALGLRWQAGAYMSRSHPQPIRFHAVGLCGRLRAGLFSRRFAVALEGGVRSAVLTHVRAGERFRDTFAQLPGIVSPTDGWYAFTALEYPVGLFAFVRLGDRWFLDGSAGLTLYRQEQQLRLFPQIGIVPFYGNIALGWRV